jgi:phosphatidylglycerol---prolipoprotein diacylglyceryl transferase
MQVMFPEILELSWITIRGYGLMIAIGVLLGSLVAKREARRRGLQALDEYFLWVAMALAVAGFLGGKLVYVWTEGEWPESLEREAIATFMRQGFVFYGMLIATVATLVLALKRLKLPLRESFDTLALGTPLAHAFGRLGCFMAGCCYGCAADLPWAVTFTEGQGLNGVALHPVQLYEAAAELLVFVWLYRSVRPRATFPGQVTLSYLCAYAVIRIGTELLRGDGNPLAWSWSSAAPTAGSAPAGITLSQATSLAILAVCVPLTIWAKRRAAPLA